MLNLRMLLVSFVFVLVAGSAHASLIANLTPFTGSGANVQILVDDLGSDIKFTVTVIDPVADIRGVFFHIGDESLLGGLSITGADVTQQVFGPANSVINLGGGNNLNGGGSPCGCDFAVEIGTPGIGTDDILTTMFTLTHTTEDLDLALFLGQNFGARLTSVGPNREGSSKLGGPVGVVPEPGTALLLGGGLMALAGNRRRHI